MACCGILLGLLVIFGSSDIVFSALSGTTVICSETTTIELNQTQADYLKLDEMDQVIISRQRLINTDGLDAKCIASQDNITFIVDLNDCDAYITEDDETITYTWTIRNHPYINESLLIQRFQDICFNVSCVFYKKQELDSGSGIFPNIRKITLDDKESEGIFDVELTLWKDKNDSNSNDVVLVELGSGDEIIVPNYIYVKVELANVDPNDTDLHVQIDDCWASPTSFSGSSIFYSIIEDGQAASNPADPADAIDVTRNYKPRIGAFHFRSFVWTNDFGDLIYVHCNVTICDAAAVGADCDSPISRRKRDGDYTRKPLKVVSGPVRVSAEKETLTCNVNNGGCSDVCSETGGDVICSCYEGRSLMYDGKLCYVNKPPIKIVRVESNTTMMPVIAMFACAVVMISCGFWSIIRRRNKKVIEV